MTNEVFRDELRKYTLDYYETEFADRHLVHGAIAKWARERPGHVAVIDAETGRQISYREFDETTTRWALKLIELGFRPGDFLATMLPLTAEHILLEYACFKIGVIHSPIDLRLKTAEVIRSLGLIEAAGFVFLGKTVSGDFSEIGRMVQAECPFIEHFIQFAGEEEVIEGALSAERFIEEANSVDEQAISADSLLGQAYRQAVASVKPTDGAQVIYTTGSTGFPKPALLSHRNITSQNMCLMAGFGMQNDPVQLVNLPPSHVGCQAEQLMTTLFAGGTAVILHVFDAENSLKAIQDYKVKIFGQIPAMFNMQWRLPNLFDYDLSSVEKCMFGGQTVTNSFVARLLEMVPLVGTGLGLTEMSGFVTYTALTDRAEDVVNSVGWEMPITPLSVRQPMKPDGTAGDELRDGETGEICFSGPQVFIDYVNNRKAYEKTVTIEGVCYTGDLGYKSERGLIFAGRSKFVIKPKGYQVHPGQIEDHFAQLNDAVAVCAAVGAPHDIFSEGIVLFVERRPESQPSRELFEAHAKGIAAYMRPSHYVVLEPGTFPLNRVNKTDYVRLSEMALAEVERLRADAGWDR